MLVLLGLFDFYSGLRGKALEVGQPEMNHGFAISLLQDLGKVI